MASVRIVIIRIVIAAALAAGAALAAAQAGHYWAVPVSHGHVVALQGCCEDD